MKANEAPEKIYIQSFNVSEEDAKFDKSKMFFDDVWTEEPEPGQENIEYVRKDAFIEKAVSYLNSKLYDWVRIEYPNPSVSPELIIKQDFIEDFKNYMKESKL